MMQGDGADRSHFRWGALESMHAVLVLYRGCTALTRATWHLQGGKRQGDETHLQTACRECREEVALDLQGPDFMLLGSLPARKAKSDMELNAFVFLHTGGGADLRPEASEVADAWWVPLPAVASRSRVQTLFRSISTAQDIPRLLRCCLQTLGVRGLLFPCLCLPPPTVSSSRSSSSRQPPLWGLTLGLTSDLLATGRIDCCGGHSPTNPLEVRVRVCACAIKEHGARVVIVFGH